MWRRYINELNYKGMNNKILLLLAALLTSSGAVYAQDFEDIYYNPKKDKTEQKVQSQPVTDSFEMTYTINSDGTISFNNYSYAVGSAYQEERDVDEYNRFGTYYSSPIDTIGNAVAGSEDFVYTQQIQKYYNPTIVVDNASVLADVLSDSYGNVNIIYENGYPSFGAYTSWSIGWPYYSGWYSPWYSSWGWGYAYSPWYWGGFYYDPWFDPWYGSWGWGGWGSSYHPPHYASGGYHRPNVSPTVGVHNGWSATARPSINGVSASHRTGTAARPSGSTSGGYHRGTISARSSTVRPSTSNSGYTTGNHRVNGTLRPNSTNSSGTIQNRPSTTTTSRPSTTTTIRPSGNTSTSRPSTSYSRPSTSTSRPSMGSGSSGGFRSSGGVSRGGGGGGRHR